MKKETKLLTTIFFVVLVILGVVWAINGYNDTWLYVTAAIIAIPGSWYYSAKKNR